MTQPNRVADPALGNLFVTGTDTGVGKTWVASRLIDALAATGRRVAAMKPIASGCAVTAEGLRNEDALALISVANVRARYEEVNPYAFAPAIAPHIAAADLGVAIDFDVLTHAYEGLGRRSDVVVVEGAGGWLCPLDEGRTFADLAAHWRLDVVLVVGLRLGCLNHALLTAESIRRRGLTLCGWVANSGAADFARRAENVATLHSRMDAPCLGDFAFNEDAEVQCGSNTLLTGLRQAGLIGKRS